MENGNGPKMNDEYGWGVKLATQLKFIELPAESRKKCGLISVVEFANALRALDIPGVSVVDDGVNMPLVTITWNEQLYSLVARNPMLNTLYSRLLPEPGWKERLALLFYHTGYHILPNAKRKHISSLLPVAKTAYEGMNAGARALITDMSTRFLLNTYGNAKKVTTLGVWDFAPEKETAPSAVVQFTRTDIKK
jgi:hypothetical protein